MTTIDRHVKYVVEAFEDGESLFTAHSHVLSFAVGSFLDLCRRYGIGQHHNEIDTFDSVGRGYAVAAHGNFTDLQVRIYAIPAQ